MSTDPKIDTENRSNYMRDYYLRNRERIMAQRKKRYQTDSAYRDKLNSQRRTRRRKSEQPDVYQSVGVDTRAEVKEEKTPPKTITMRVIHPENRDTSCVCEFFTLTQTALVLGADLKRMQTWLSKDKLPQPRYRSNKNWRLYTEYEVSILNRVFVKYKRRAKAENYVFRLNQEMKTEIEAKFKSLIAGVPADRFEITNEQ